MTETDLTDLEDELEPDAAPDFTDADAFFAAEVLPVKPAVLRMYDRDYPLPTDVPLAFTLLSERHFEEADMTVLQDILTPIFGVGALDYWISRGCGLRRLSIVLGWVIGNIEQPGSTTMAEAAKRYDDATAGKAAAVPAPNRAARRAATSGGKSSRTGRKSKRTSGATTT